MNNDSTDVIRYQRLQAQQLKDWENLCSRCGACCGVVDGDPCEHLRAHQKGMYYCSIYENRFGEHQTVSGKKFVCVPIRNILHKSWPGDGCCGYKKH